MTPTPSEEEVSAWGAAGDKVAVYTTANALGPAGVTIERIHAITKTQVVLVSGRRFRRDDGRERGNHGDQLMRPESDRVQDAIAASMIPDMSLSLHRATRDVRNRAQAIKALRESHEIVLRFADYLGVNRADLG